MIVSPFLQSPTAADQTCLPESASSATRFPSSLPRYTRPSPIATPRLVQPQHTVLMLSSRLPLYCQIVLPLLTSSAKTSFAPVDR